MVSVDILRDSVVLEVCSICAARADLYSITSMEETQSVLSAGTRGSGGNKVY